MAQPDAFCLGDTGNALAFQFVDQDGAAIDVSGADELLLLVRKKSGAVESLAVDFEDDGTDGWVLHEWEAGELDEVGLWTGNGYYREGALELRGVAAFQFRVKNIFEL